MLAPGFMTKVMGALNSAEQSAAASYEYPKVQQELSALRSAVEAAIAADEAEADSFWTDLSRLAKHTVNFFSERARFNAEAAAVKGQAREALSRVEQLCASRVGVHAGVPARLDSDSDAWLTRAKRVAAMQGRAAKLRDIAGWEGAARDGYTAAATVQINALTELEGVMESTAQGCKVGASLNRAIFYVVAKAIRLATGRIRSAPGSSGDQYYRRTVTARNECQALLGEIRRAVNGEVAAGSSAALAKECAQTITMPNLLEVGSWPTGTSGVNTTPANTSDGVRTEGDGNLNTGGGGGGKSSPGVGL